MTLWQCICTIDLPLCIISLKWGWYKYTVILWSSRIQDNDKSSSYKALLVQQYTYYTVTVVACSSTRISTRWGGGGGKHRAKPCVCVCVCVCGLVRTYIRGQFCVFNHLTGDVRQVGTSPDVFTSPINFLSHFEHVWYIQCIFLKLSPYGR